MVHSRHRWRTTMAVLALQKAIFVQIAPFHRKSAGFSTRRAVWEKIFKKIRRKTHDGGGVKARMRYKAERK